MKDIYLFFFLYRKMTFFYNQQTWLSRSNLLDMFHVPDFDYDASQIGTRVKAMRHIITNFVATITNGGRSGKMMHL